MSLKNIKRLMANLKNVVKVKRTIHKRKQIFNDEIIEIATMGYFAVYPMTFLGEVVLQTGLSKSYIHRILLKLKFYQYSIPLVQHLEDPDLPTRVHCCEFI